MGGVVSRGVPLNDIPGPQSFLAPCFLSTVRLKKKKNPTTHSSYHDVPPKHMGPRDHGLDPLQR